MMRALLLFAVLLTMSSPAAAVSWDWVGDLHTGGGTCMLPDPAHDRLIIGGGDGYRVYYPLSDEWLIRDGNGSSSVRSLLAHPTDPLFLLTGWYGTLFYGWIMDNYGLVTTGPHVLDGTFGAIMGMGRLPENEDTLFACVTFSESPGGVFRSLDGGQNWTLVHNLHFDSSGTALAVATNGDVLVGHGSVGYPYTGNGILRSEDGGDTWVEIAGDMPCAAFIGQVEVDPLDPQHIYVAQGGTWEPWDPALGVWETTDGGVHWEQIFGGNVFDLCMDPTDGDVLVALFDSGIVLTRNGGGTWVDIQGNVPGFRVCAISPTDDRIYVATHSDGLWATDASPTGAGEAPAASLELGAHPNPFNPQTTLAFSLRESGVVSLSVLDAQGRCVRSLLAAATLPAGSQSVAWDGRDEFGRALPSGLYFARLIAGEERVSRKLLLLK